MIESAEKIKIILNQEEQPKVDEKENTIHEADNASEYETIKDKTWVDNSISVIQSNLCPLCIIEVTNHSLINSMLSNF